jgi:hypothetical protein
MLDQHLLENYLKENYEVYDRFTFDKVFRFLLSNGYQKEEAKDIILHNCALSALVLQERIHNGYYYRISVNEEISKDLIEFRNEIAEKIMTLKGKEFRRFCDYLNNKRINPLDSFQNDQKSVKKISSLTIQTTFAKIQTIYGQLQQALGVQIKPAPDEWDRLYNVDFFIEVDDKYIGLQIKPTTFKHTFEDYKWKEMQETSHRKFQKRFAGKVFIVFSVKEGQKKRIKNTEVIDEIKNEIERLRK